MDAPLTEMGKSIVRVISLGISRVLFFGQLRYEMFQRVVHGHLELLRSSG